MSFPLNSLDLEKDALIFRLENDESIKYGCTYASFRVAAKHTIVSAVSSRYFSANLFSANRETVSINATRQSDFFSTACITKIVCHFILERTQ